MRYRILGHLEVLDDDGRSIVLGGTRERVVLGALLLNANAVVSKDRLIHAVWGAEAPQTAGNALQVHVSRLRKAISANDVDGPIQTRSPGYVLRTSPGELDLEEFERLVVPPKGGNESNGEAAERLTQALALWRGPLLDGLDVGSFALGDVTRLEEQRLAALEAKLEAQLALGLHRELIGELEALVREHPTREELRRLQMLALYRSGRQSEALASYTHMRQILADELGIDPGPALQSLELAILKHAPELELEQPPAPPARPDSSPVSTQVPIPRALQASPSVGLLGRDEQAATIRAAYERVAELGGLELVLISGESGLGKTTLAADGARAAFASGATVLLGRGSEDVVRPYELFAEPLRHLIENSADDLLLELLGDGTAELARLVPSLDTRLAAVPASRATDADAERYLLLAEVTRLLLTASMHRPVVLVLDDLQWADRASLQLLRHLVNSTRAARLLIIATYRDLGTARTDELVATLGDLHRHAAVTRIELQGLDEFAVVTFLEAAAGGGLDDAATSLASTVFRETDGNPLFVGQVVRHLTESGALHMDDQGRWTAASNQVALPVSVREVINARVVRLGKEAVRTLSLAAVIGRDFDVDLLSAASGESEAELLDLLDEAEGAGLVRDLALGQYSFTHALIQRTLYEELRPTRRANAHRTLAEALEERYGDSPGDRIGELARHWCMATQSVDVLRAIEYSRKAGDAALAALAPQDAAAYYQQALELSERLRQDDEGRTLDLSIGLGTAQRQSGNPAFRGVLLGAARRAIEIGDAPRLVAAALANDRGTFSTIDRADDEKLAVLEEALASPGLSKRDRAQLLAILCSESTVGTPLEHRQQLAEEAVMLAEQNADDDAYVRVLNHVLLPLAVPPLMNQVVGWSIEGLERATRVSDPLQLCSALSGRRYTAACTGDLVEMDRCFALKESLVKKLDQPFLAWVERLQGATRALLGGNHVEAERLAGEALKIGMVGGEPDAFLAFGMQTLMIALCRGTMGELVPLITSAIEDNPRLLVLRAALALAHAEAGSLEQAAPLLDDFVDAGCDLPMDVTWLTGMVAYALAAVETGHRGLAARLLDALSTFEGQWHYSDLAASGPLDRTLGGLATIVGRLDDAERYLESAAEAIIDVDSALLSSWNDLYLGRLLLARGADDDRDTARATLDRARKLASAQGFLGIATRAERVLRESR